jgi:hypothetical protein
MKIDTITVHLVLAIALIEAVYVSAEFKAGFVSFLKT